MIQLPTLRRAAFPVILGIALGCGGDTTGPSIGPPVSISFVGGSTQTGVVGASLATTPQARVTDASGTGVAGVQVVFDVLAGGGTISGDSAVTDAQGIASVASWQLGPTPGLQTLRVQAVGKPLLATLNVTASAGAPSSVQVVEGASGLSAIVGQTVLTTPVVRIRDTFGNPIANTSVTWSVTAGGGSIIGPTTTTTDASGRATIQGWTLGSFAGTNALQARTSNGITAVITAVGIGVPAGIEAGSQSPSSQSGVSSFLVAKTPRVRVFDAQNQPVAGVPVTFALVSGPGTGSIAGVNAITDGSGIAALGDWRIGASGTSIVRATVPGLSGQSVEFQATGTPRAFTIDLRFLEPPPANLRDDFVAGVLRWMEIITGDLPATTVNFAADGCNRTGISHPAVNETIDDMVIFATVRQGDGPGGVLGSAGGCLARNGTGLTSIGLMEFDLSDASTLSSNGQFIDVVIHELGHVLGLERFTWSARALVTGLGGNDPFYIGAQGLAGWNTLGVPYSGTPVPVENTGGAGTAGSHWREGVLGNEIMTGFIEAPGVSMPLTRLTAGAIADLGYAVDMSKTDAFVSSLRQGAPEPEGRVRINEIIFGPSMP